MLIFSLLVSVFVGCVLSENVPYIPPNPCPSVFNYYYDTDGSMFGEILVPNDGSKVYRMEVNTSYVGIFTEESKPMLFLNLTTPDEALLDARQLTYKLSFTKQDNVPRITQIKFNDRIYCRGPSGPVTSAGLSKLWVFKETRLHQFSYYPDESYQPVVPTRRPTMPPYIPPRSTTPYPWFKPIEVPDIYPKPEPIMGNPLNQDQECGISDTRRAVNLITDGYNVTVHEFPWLVALYEWKGLNYQFRCTGNLIDKSHVLTVGSCLKFFNSNLVRPSDILLVFGSSDLTQWAGRPDMLVRKVSRVDTNPDYTQYSAHGDVAVLTLEQPVQYSKTVRPICLWDGNTEIERLVGRSGIVAGWGKDEQQIEYLATAKKVQMPVVSQDVCQRSNPQFSRILSDDTFCAGQRNGRGPCTGDIGSPFMLEMNGKWYLRGMVSQAIVNRMTSLCTLVEYIAFTDVAKYSRWISTKQINF